MYDQKSNVSLARKNGSVRNLALFIASGHKKKCHINITFEFQIVALSLRNNSFIEFFFRFEIKKIRKEFLNLFFVFLLLDAETDLDEGTYFNSVLS